MADAVPLYQHWNDIYSRRGQILLTAAAAGAVGYFASEVIPPVYEAKTSFYIAETVDPPGLTFGGQAPRMLFPTPEEKVSSLNLGILRGADLMRRLNEASPERDLAALTRATDFVVSGEFMIDVFVRDPDPQLAALIANRVPELYREFHGELLRDQARRAQAALDGWITDLAAELSRLRGMRTEQLATLGAASADGLLAQRLARREAAAERLQALAAEFEQARAERMALARALEEERALYRPGEMVLTSSAIERQAALLAELRVSLAELTEGPAGARRQGIESEIAEIERLMAAEIAELQASVSKPAGSVHEVLRGNLVELDTRLAALETGQAVARRTLDSLDSELGLTATEAAALAELEARISEVEGDLRLARSNRDEALLQSAHADVPLVIVQQALPPERPVFPLQVLNTVVATLTGLVFGVYLALIFGYVGRLRERRILHAVTGPALGALERDLLAEAARAGRARG